MPATEITDDIGIVNAALAGLSMNPIVAFTDNTEQAKLANATYRQHLETVLSEHPWNFAMKHATLDMAIKPKPAWRWDYAFSTPADTLRVWEVEDQSADEYDEWTISDRLLLTNLTQNLQTIFGAVVANTLDIEAHGYLEGDVVVAVKGGDVLPTGVSEDTLYFVKFITVDKIQLAITSGGANILLTNDGGADNVLIRRTVDIRYIQYVSTVTLYSAQFLSVLIAKLEAEWAEPLVKATTLGDRKDKKFDEKMAAARSIDGQEGTPERQDTSTWIDAR